MPLIWLFEFFFFCQDDYIRSWDENQGSNESKWSSILLIVLYYCLHSLTFSQGTKIAWNTKQWDCLFSNGAFFFRKNVQNIFAFTEELMPGFLSFVFVQMSWRSPCIFFSVRCTQESVAVIYANKSWPVTSQYANKLRREDKSQLRMQIIVGMST